MIRPVITLVAIAAAPPAQVLYDRGDIAGARAAWQHAAAQGDVRAMLGLAMLADTGAGGAADPVQASEWYTRAAKLGSDQAELDIAVLDDSGQPGHPRDPAAAADWYARAAAHGNLRAAYDLGLLYADGDGVPRNDRAAAAWFGAASASLSAARQRREALAPSLRAEADGPLVPPRPAPAAVPPGASGPRAVELVWTAPPEPRAVRYEVSVWSMKGTTPLAPVVRAGTDRTAIIVALPPGSGPLAWRVDAVGLTDRRYAASGWATVTFGR